MGDMRFMLQNHVADHAAAEISQKRPLGDMGDIRTL